MVEAAPGRREWQAVKQVGGELIVSCQASTGEPLCSPEHILALALSAINGGAGALRLEGVENIKLVRANTKLPIIGLTKDDSIAPSDRLKKVYITGSFAEAESLAQAGADIIALDATGRPRPDGLTLKEQIEKIHNLLNLPVWADVATFSEGVAAREAGADVISSTMYGYTEETVLPPEHGPSFEFLKDLCQHMDCPVILEGRVWHPEEVTRAFELGVHAVVVGSAITRPQLITQRFVKAIPARKTDRH
ncbi:MAG TPA: N-acetylmannosamine-6-phosphate 2-epimerase [Candidatus Melainabacteria bacterium]|jgi:N-acylglucosamine-6-phosphate 2-epimerase|nr:N-acetylmannosamine-6-phosphate 2-epimerase [Candidatus Melainabacteria bacterium]HIN65329.1 N-acetylmannosamine-6-phosphate 2-epimerase [Candidatus Obscuribacterales bacterium]